MKLQSESATQSASNASSTATGAREASTAAMDQSELTGGHETAHRLGLATGQSRPTGGRKTAHRLGIATSSETVYKSMLYFVNGSTGRLALETVLGSSYNSSKYGTLFRNIY